MEFLQGAARPRMRFETKKQGKQKLETSLKLQRAARGFHGTSGLLTSQENCSPVLTYQWAQDGEYPMSCLSRMMQNLNSPNWFVWLRKAFKIRFLSPLRTLRKYSQPMLI